MNKCETTGCNTQVGSKLNERYCSKCVADAKKFAVEYKKIPVLTGNLPRRVVN